MLSACFACLAQSIGILLFRRNRLNGCRVSEGGILLKIHRLLLNIVATGTARLARLTAGVGAMRLTRRG
jgi:hypothetical protein